MSSHRGEANLAAHAVARFLRTLARLNGVPWSDQLHAEIIAAIGNTIRQHRPYAN